MDFRNSPHPDLAAKLEKARAQWQQRVEHCIKEIMLKYPELSSQQARYSLNTAALQLLDSGSSYSDLMDAQNDYLPRKPEHELDVAIDENELLDSRKFLTQNVPADEFYQQCLPFSHCGMLISQLNALQREIHRLCEQLFPDGSDRLFWCPNPEKYLSEAEVVWEKHPEYLIILRKIVFLQGEFNRIARNPLGLPDFQAAHNQTFPGPSVEQLLRTGLRATFDSSSLETELFPVAYKRDALSGESGQYNRWYLNVYLHEGLSPWNSYTMSSSLRKRLGLPHKEWRLKIVYE